MAEPQTFEDLLGAPGNPQSFEDLLAEAKSREANVQAGKTPQGLTPEQQAQGAQFYKETLPRSAVASAVALGTAPFTAGMSLLPAALTEAGVIGAGDLGYQGVRKLMDPSREINPRESADIGAAAGLSGGATRGGLSIIQNLLGRIARVPQPAINAVTDAAPQGGPKAWRMMKSAPSNAEKTLADAGRASVLAQRAPSLPAAEAAVASYNQPVDTTPILERIVTRYRAKPVNAAEEAANAHLDDLANRLPESMSMGDLEDYLRRIRVPVKDKIGKEGGSLAVQDVKDIQSFVTQYRDSLLRKAGGGAGADAFAASSQEIDAIKKFRNLILDKNGDLRRSAENTFRRLPSNHVIMDRVDRYDAVAGTNLGQQARALAIKRQWNPADTADAGALTEILARLSRGNGVVASVVQPLARGMLKIGTAVLPPRGWPQAAAGAGAGGVVSYDKEWHRVRARDAATDQSP